MDGVKKIHTGTLYRDPTAKSIKSHDANQVINKDRNNLTSHSIEEIEDVTCDKPDDDQGDEGVPSFDKNVDNHELVIISDDQEESKEDVKAIPIEGRRIVDIQYFINQLLEISQHSLRFDCQLNYLKIVKEVRHGLSSYFTMRCFMCGSKFQLNTSENDKKFDVNHAAVAGIIMIGCGLSNFNELAATTDLPTLTGAQYKMCQDDLHEWWKKTAEDTMKDAAEEEAEMASEKSSTGKPMIPVTADACWSKRSYRTNYSSLSGVGAIIGVNSGKVLHLGVKNKYCVICARAKNKEEKAPKHQCNINHKGSSTSMEQAAIVEGFKKSEKDHNLVYSKLIADGDASTYKNILDARPYTTVKVEKIECSNHLLRNYNGKNMALNKDTSIPLDQRKLLTTERLNRLRVAVKAAVRFRKAENSPTAEQIKKLQKDILNSPLHIFGDHSNCEGYYCKNEKKVEPNYIPHIPVLLKKLSANASSLAFHAKSLLHNLNNNSNGPVEGAYGPQHSPVSRSDASTEDAELSAALAHQHHLAMQAGEYTGVGAGVDPDYGQYVSSPAAHYNHLGHLTMAPSQKYPHVMDSVSVSGGGTYGATGGHYGTYGHYGATAYPAQPAYMDPPPQVPQYIGQEYGEGGGSGSPRSASPGTLPPQHNLHLQQRYDSASLEQIGRHYCVTSPRAEYAADAYGYQHYPAAYDPTPHQPPQFKDSQNGLSLGSAGGQSMYGDEEELQKQMAGMALVHGGVGGHEDGGGLQWRDPNLPEVIGFLNSPSDVVKANAAAYLQHLTYMDDPNKQKTRSLGGIPPLVRLVSHENPEVCRNACGALRNLSYGRQNDENKRCIRDAGGIPQLMALLCRATDMEVKELVTGVIWNMSSCEDLKQSIIDDAAQVIVNKVIIPHSGWHPSNPGDTYWSTVFRNASGVLRNASSAGEYARRRLRGLPGLAEALLHCVRAAIQCNAIGTKIVENCVCVLRNLSYRCQEIEDPLYDTRAPPTQSSGQARIQASASKGENLGCFGGSKKKKEGASSSNSTSPLGKSEPLAAPPDALGYSVPKGTEMLWSPEVVPLYMALLQTCSNPETLEAAAGALQNLAACYWQPSIDIRAAVRKEKGLPILVELLRMEVDRVVCAVATALRNLAIDQRNKELIGKYAMRDLVQKLPSGNQQHEGTSDDTIAAVLATLNEVIKKSGEFSRSLLEAGGVERLLALTKQRLRHTPRVLKFAGQVLMTMWSHAELREVYRKHGWREADFLTPARAAAPRAAPNSSGAGTPGAPHSPSNANSTLSRPMASTGGTRYEDRTIRRHRENEDPPAMDANYQDGMGVGNPNGRPVNLQGVQASMPPPSSR